MKLKLPKPLTLSIIPAAIRHGARVGGMLIRRNAFLLLAFIAASIALAQSRTDDFPLANVRVTEIVLTPRPDGGCGARWCGVVDRADGGVQLAACTDTVELGGNLGRCTGLATAGTLRVAKELQFAVTPAAP